MRGNLLARVDKLEEVAGKNNLPNNGLCFVVMQEAETRRAAITRTMKTSPYAYLTPAQLRRMTPVIFTEDDIGVL